jgi:hypothetical protein
MKKGVTEFIVFTLFLLVLLSSGVFAASPLPGKCAIVAKADCDSPSEGYVLMGLSAATNAHAQNWVYPNNNYPYVLCCNFGSGNKNCTGNPPTNKVVGLSSLTNAHAEVPSLNNYQTVKICYEDLQCRASTSGCSSSANEIEVVNLSSLTNAHVGVGVGFQTAVCCTSPFYLSSCTLKSARWNLEEAIEGQGVRLEVIGSGLECNNQAVSFEIKGGSSPVDANPVSVGFNGDKAIGIWYAEYQKCGLFGLSDCSYYFNASIVRSIPSKSILSSDPKLTVKKANIEDVCASVTICGDYDDMGKCESDASLCDVAKDSSMEGVDCSSAEVSCTCVWNTAENKCEFSYTEIKSELCGNGFTLCHSPSGIDYCYPGASCPSGQNPPSDNDGVCEVDESCASGDCKDGDQASCAPGTKCQGGKCYSETLPVETPTCNYGFTLCREPVSGINYCYPGASCLEGNEPLSNNNSRCDFGEGCLSADCNDGDQDTCSNETYCSLGKCASVQAPIDLGVLGGCKISQTIEKTCEEEPAGYKILKWTGVWTGDIDPSNPAYQKCITGGSSTVPCPAQVQLPFFDYYEIAITVAVIILIYVSLIFRRKFKKGKK